MSRNFFGYEPKGDAMSRHFGLRAKTAAQELRDRNADMPPTRVAIVVALLVLVIIVGALVLK